MKQLFFFFLLSTQVQATTLSPSVFLNDHAGFEVTDEETATFEHSIGDLIELNSNVVESSFGDNGKPTPKWKVTGYVTSLGVNSSGKLGVLGFKGSALAEIYWRKKKKIANTFAESLKEEEHADSEISDLSDNGINNSLEQLMAVIKGSHKITNPETARIGLKQKLAEFSNLVKGLHPDPTKPWYLGGIRLDLVVAANGTLSSTMTMAGSISLRIVWVPVKVKDVLPPHHSIAEGSLATMIDDFSNVLSELTESKNLEEKGLKLNTVRFGLGLSGAGNVVFGKMDGSLVFSVLMNKNLKYKSQNHFNEIELKNHFLPVSSDSNIKMMDWNVFKKGMTKALKLSNSLLRKNVDGDHNKHNWEIYMTRTSFSVNPTKGVGVVTVGGVGQLQMIHRI